MKRIVSLLSIFVVCILGLLVYSPQHAFADDTCPLTLDKPTVDKDFKGKVTITAEKKVGTETVGCLTPGRDYRVIYTIPGQDNWNDFGDGNNVGAKANDDGKTITFDMNIKKGETSPTGDRNPGDWNIILCLRKDKLMGNDDYCHTKNGNVIGRTVISVGGDAKPADYDLPLIVPAQQAACKFKVDTDVTLKASRLTENTGYRWWMVEDDDHNGEFTTGAGETTHDFIADASSFSDTGSKRICVDKQDENKHVTSDNCIRLDFSSIPPDGSVACTDFRGPVIDDYSPPCSIEIDSGGCSEVKTALGDLSTRPELFIPQLMGILLSISGGIALLMIIRSGYQILTSRGDAEKVKEAQERLTSVVVGLLFIVLALVILEVIGVDLLHIPGFSR